MRIGIDYGLEHLDVEVPDSSLVSVHRQPPAPPLDDLGAAVRNALEHPLGFPALRLALTPDDHVAIVMDRHLPRAAALLQPLLEHITAAHVAPQAITLLGSPASDVSDVRDDLPLPYREVRVEVHDPANRKELSYLATTRRGRRVYLNRTVVDADQVVVLARCAYDPLLGYSGSEGAIYPAFADEATHREMRGRLSLDVPGGKPWAPRKEAAEVAWLLGAPFMVQVIPGAGDEVLHVVGGLADAASEGQRLLDARWRVGVDEPAETVIASVGGDPAGQDFGDLASALACAARVVSPQGRILLLSQVGPALDPAAELLRQAEDPDRALALLREQAPPGMAAAFQWASSVGRARVYLLSQLPVETAEELFTTPLENAGQVQRLLRREGSYLFLADAHKTLAVLRGGNGVPS